jgi:hypothetical protein
MKKIPSDDEKRVVETIMFNIMSGNSGSAFALLREMGGSSGAALPTTVVSNDSAILFLPVFRFNALNESFPPPSFNTILPFCSLFHSSQSNK